MQEDDALNRKKFSLQDSSERRRKNMRSLEEQIQVLEQKASTAANGMETGSAMTAAEKDLLVAFKIELKKLKLAQLQEGTRARALGMLPRQSRRGAWALGPRDPIPELVWHIFPGS